MAQFKYTARDRLAKPVSGVIISSTQEEAVSKLHELGYFPLTITEQRESLTNLKSAITLFNRVQLKELHVFTRQLCALQKAGLTLLVSLETIGSETPNRYFKTIIEKIATDIKAGTAFSDSLKKFNSVFDDIYISMIKAAESGGLMAEMLDRLAHIIEKEIDTRSRIKEAVRYPMLAFFVICAGFTILTIFVIPRFANIYSQFKTPLPIPTQILISTNIFIRKFWYVCIGLLAVMIFGWMRFIKTQYGRFAWDKFKLKVAIFGPLFTMLLMSRIIRVIAVLIRSGVPLLQIMELVVDTSGNTVIVKALKKIKEDIKEGKGISGPMKETGLFPSIVIQMVFAGEKSGRLDELLLDAADYYDLETGYIIRNLSTYIEPILIFILGLMVLVMALGIFLPMWNIIRIFQH